MPLPAYQALDEFDYHPRLATARGTALVLFSSPDCGTCRSVELRLPEAVSPGVSLFHVDVQRSPALARAFDLFHLPALLLYHDGVYHARLDCPITPASLAAAIERALAAPAEEEP